MKLFDPARIADLFCSANETACVHLALGDLQNDLLKICGRRPTLKPFLPVEEENLVLIGTVQNPEFLDCLARRGVTTSVTQGEWETYQIKTFGANHQNLLIVGSDTRGAMWGIYEFSRLYLGIDPLYFWTEQKIEPPGKSGAWNP